MRVRWTLACSELPYLIEKRVKTARLAFCESIVIRVSKFIWACVKNKKLWRNMYVLAHFLNQVRVFRVSPIDVTFSSL